MQSLGNLTSINLVLFQPKYFQYDNGCLIQWLVRALDTLAKSNPQLEVIKIFPWLTQSLEQWQWSALDAQLAVQGASMFPGFRRLEIIFNAGSADDTILARTRGYLPLLNAENKLLVRREVLKEWVAGMQEHF